MWNWLKGLFTKKYVESLLRHALNGLGALIVGAGIADEATVVELIPGLTTVGAGVIIWAAAWVFSLINAKNNSK